MLGRRKTINGITKTSNVVLLGGTGCGKSSIGMQLARLLGYGLYDIDYEIEKSFKKRIADIFEEEGEAKFREMESDRIRTIENLMSHVIVAGAGAVQDADNWERLQKIGSTVWISTPIREIAGRFLLKPNEIKSRPFLADISAIADRSERQAAVIKRLEDLATKREAQYAKADYSVVNSYCTPENAACMIKHMLFAANK